MDLCYIFFTAAFCLMYIMLMPRIIVAMYKELM